MLRLSGGREPLRGAQSRSAEIADPTWLLSVREIAKVAHQGGHAALAALRAPASVHPGRCRTRATGRGPGSRSRKSPPGRRHESTASPLLCRTPPPPFEPVAADLP